MRERREFDLDAAVQPPTRDRAQAGPRGTRKRLMRQLLVESALLSLVGGAAGFMLGIWVQHAGNTMIPKFDFETVETAYTFGVDWRIVLFTATISLIAGLICGLTPALQGSQADLSSALKGTFRIRNSGRFRNVLVVTQVALSIVLLFCSGLSVRSALNAHDIDPGFTTRNLFLMRVNLELQGYDQAHRRQFYRDVRQRLESLPGVAQASVGFPLPLDSYDMERTAVPEGFVPGPGTERGFNVGYSVVAPGYFATMQTRLDAGREFTEADSDATERAVIVNHVLAQKFWPAENPIGKRVRLGVSEGPFATVIGIAHDGKFLRRLARRSASCFWPRSTFRVRRPSLFAQRAIRPMPSRRRDSKSVRSIRRWRYSGFNYWPVSWPAAIHIRHIGDPSCGIWSDRIDTCQHWALMV